MTTQSPEAVSRRLAFRIEQMINRQYAAIEAREAMAEELRQQEYRVTMRWQPGPVQAGAQV